MSDLRVTLTSRGAKMVVVVAYPNGGKRVKRDTQIEIPYALLGMHTGPNGTPSAQQDQVAVLRKNREQLAAMVSDRRKEREGMQS